MRQHRARQHYSSPPDRDVDDAVKAGVPWVLGSKGKMMKKTDHTFLIAALLSIFGLAHANDPCNCQGYAGIGGPCYAGVGGPAYAGVGGPAYAGVGGACYAGIGGPAYSGISGPKYDGIGGPSYKVLVAQLTTASVGQHTTALVDPAMRVSGGLAMQA